MNRQKLMRSKCTTGKRNLFALLSQICTPHRDFLTDADSKASVFYNVHKTTGKGEVFAHRSQKSDLTFYI